MALVFQLPCFIGEKGGAEIEKLSEYNQLNTIFPPFFEQVFASSSSSQAILNATARGLNNSQPTNRVKTMSRGRAAPRGRSAKRYTFFWQNPPPSLGRSLFVPLIPYDMGRYGSHRLFVIGNSRVGRA